MLPWKSYACAVKSDFCSFAENCESITVPGSGIRKLSYYSAIAMFPKFVTSSSLALLLSTLSGETTPPSLIPKFHKINVMAQMCTNMNTKMLSSHSLQTMLKSRPGKFLWLLFSTGSFFLSPFLNSLSPQKLQRPSMRKKRAFTWTKAACFGKFKSSRICSTALTIVARAQLAGATTSSGRQSGTWTSGVPDLSRIWEE